MFCGTEDETGFAGTMIDKGALLESLKTCSPRSTVTVATCTSSASFMGDDATLRMPQLRFFFELVSGGTGAQCVHFTPPGILRRHVHTRHAFLH